MSNLSRSQNSMPLRSDLRALNTSAPLASEAGINPLIPTVFHNRWWLDVASTGLYEEVEIKSGGEIVARMPYLPTRRFGLYRVCVMPELTHFLGPGFAYDAGLPANRSLKHHQLLLEMLSKIDLFHGFHQQLHHGVTDTLAFEERGYSTMMKFTYEISPRSPGDIWGAMRDKTRNAIRRASEKWVVKEFVDCQAFAAAYDANLVSRKLVNRYRRVAEISRAALANDQGRILCIEHNGNLLGALFIVWDRRTAYYLMSTRSPAADNGVMSLLLWEAILLTASAGLTFDFDGLGTSGSRVFYTGFGGNIKPRFVVYRNTSGLRVLNEVDRRITRWAGKARK